MKSSKTFEENIARLEQIVRIMEKGEVPLDESLNLFREGTSLVQSCAKLLDDAEAEVMKVVVNADNSPCEVPFHEDV